MSFVGWLAVQYMYHDPVRCVYRYRWRKSRRSKNKHLTLYLNL